MPLTATRPFASVAAHALFVASTLFLATPRASAQQGRTNVAHGFRLTVAAGPSAVYQETTPATMPGPAGERLAGADGEGPYLALGLARPVGRALVFRVEAAYNRLTSPPNAYVFLDSTHSARSALRDETLTVGSALQIRWREDRTRWAPYLVTGAGASLGRIGTNTDPSAAAVSERRTLLRASVSYGLGVDLPLRRVRGVTGAFTEVRMYRMLGPAHGSEFVPISLGLRF